MVPRLSNIDNGGPYTFKDSLDIGRVWSVFDLFLVTKWYKGQQAYIDQHFLTQGPSQQPVNSVRLR